MLERFTAGLTDAGHTSEVVDLYAIKFDPVFRDRDVASYTSGDIPADILELMDLEQRVLRSCRGPAPTLPGVTSDARQVTLRDRGHDPQPTCPRTCSPNRRRSPPPTRLAFIAPVHFCSFPSILKGWIDRVFTLDFAFGLTSEGWHGDINGQDPAPAPSAGADHDLDDLRQERLRRRHPRRHRQGHRRLGLPLPRHRRRRTRLLLRRHRGLARDHPAPTSTRPTSSARTSACPASASIARHQLEPVVS